MSYGSIRFCSESKKSSLGQVFLGWVRVFWPILPCLALSKRWKLTVPWQKIEADKQDHLHPKKKKGQRCWRVHETQMGTSKMKKSKGENISQKNILQQDHLFVCFIFGLSWWIEVPLKVQFLSSPAGFVE